MDVETGFLIGTIEREARARGETWPDDEDYVDAVWERRERRHDHEKEYEEWQSWSYLSPDGDEK